MIFPKDLEKAVEWYPKAADAGNGDAMFRNGICYENGDGANQEILKIWHKVDHGSMAFTVSMFEDRNMILLDLIKHVICIARIGCFGYHSKAFSMSFSAIT